MNGNEPFKNKKVSIKPHCDSTHAEIQRALFLHSQLIAEVQVAPHNQLQTECIVQSLTLLHLSSFKLFFKAIINIKWFWRQAGCDS